ncbi:ankyrin-3 isoform X3 [Anastrepha ludens]|uniref:ankyrin-3 isoform X3 n=1 Tax=Anastrepha ludens TaxID=28586 RepID=UPI0023B1EABD|nr:ankyrin-3 isoform X3 [Anastrepha ludens]
MTLGEILNGNVSVLTKNSDMSLGQTIGIQKQNNQHQTDEMAVASTNEKNTNIIRNTTAVASKQNDATISFLRAARSGDLCKVLDFLESGQITDINACNANGLNALHLAAKDGYIDIVSELLRRGIKVDNATKKGNTALHIASLAGQKDVIKLLIQYNANANVQSLNGFTPLYMAAQENHDACVRFLLAKGANPSLATEDGFTPLAVAMQQGHDKVVAVLLECDVRGKVRLPALHIAAKKNDVDTATLLLQSETNPDVVSKSGFTPLHIAAHYGNVDIAKLLIERRADVNFTAKHNITPLHVACKWGKTNILELLLLNKANINATTRDGLTPLHCAARSGHVEVIEILLANKSPILSKTKNGLAPLHMAAQGEHDEAAQILLAHKAPVDEVTVDYLTALHVAAHCGHVRVAKLLLNYNSDPNARALNGFTPLHIACKKNRINVVELLLKHGASISATTESGLTPLHVASFMGCMNIVIYLLQHDALPDAPTVRGETPLHLAARANQTDIIRILLRNGANVEARAREGQTPLHVASRLGNIDIIMLMLQHDANVDATTKDMYTPLHIAAKEGQEEVAQLLAENNAQLDTVTKKGFTPLHLAAKYGKEKVIALLLQRGAKIDCQGKNDVTPLHVAAHFGHQKVMFLLLEHGASPLLCAKNGHSALHIAAKKNEMEIAQQLLQFGADPDIRSKSGFSPLHLAAQEGQVDMVNLLLEHGVGVNVQAKNGLTPLHLCAQEDKAEIARILLDHQANISERTKAGYTPLHIAAHYGQINMVKFLLENDANIEMSTNVGYTPLHQAAQQGHTMVINLLLRHKANPNAIADNGQTALSIANNLGYITAVETLKVVTEKSVTNIITGVLEEKYKVAAPELMHETFMSDSDDEGGDEHIDHHQYKYMATDDLRASEQDHQNYDTTKNDDNIDNRLQKQVQQAQYTESAGRNTFQSDKVNEGFASSTQYPLKQIDNVVITRPPVHLGFLVSFLVDARGGSMRGCRHSGVRVIVPPKACTQPTRITCRYVKPQRVHNPPPLMEGEALVSRIMELSPVEAKFLGPVVLEVPHFGSLRDKEREIIILRSDNGDSWREHTLYDNDAIDAMIEVLQETIIDGLNPLEDLHTNRIVRILTRNFPQFFAVVSRIRQEVHAIGPDGGTVSSQAVPHVQAIFPPHALTKKIRVGLQAQPVDLNSCCKLLGQGVAVSPVVTVEPRRRKFHKAITLSIPAPKACTQGMVNSSYTGNAPTLRLLCSITGGPNRAVWEDVTGSTPFAFVKDSVTFTTTVSARFWLMDCRNIADASRMATELYSYMTQVPFIVKFVVFAKRVSATEAKLSVFCMTDDKEDKTLEQQEFFTEIAKSRDVEILEDQDVYLEFAGNLVPVLKSGEQFNFKFQAFRENRLSFIVHVKDEEEPYGRISFMGEAKIGLREPPQQPICILNISLERRDIMENANRLDGSQKSLNNIKIDRGLNYRDLLNAGIKSIEFKPSTVIEGAIDAREAGFNQGITLHVHPDGRNVIHKADMHLSDICDLIDDDWMRLAKELGVPEADIESINAEYTEPTSQKSTVMLHLWLRQQGHKATGNALEHALSKINRNDVMEKCIFNMEAVKDNMEQRIAKSQLDESESSEFELHLNQSIEIYYDDSKQAPTAINDISVLNDSLPTNEQTRQSKIYKINNGNKNIMSTEVENNLETSKSVTSFDQAATTNTPSPIPNEVSQLVHTDYDIDNIRRIAEEHTQEVLDEAQKNIQTDGSLNPIIRCTDINTMLRERRNEGDGRKIVTTYTNIPNAGNEEELSPIYKQNRQGHVVIQDTEYIEIQRAMNTTDTNITSRPYEGICATTHCNDGQERKPSEIDLNQKLPKDALLRQIVSKINELQVDMDNAMENLSCSPTIISAAPSSETLPITTFNTSTSAKTAIPNIPNYHSSNMAAVKASIGVEYLAHEHNVMQHEESEDHTNAIEIVTQGEIEHTILP